MKIIAFPLTRITVFFILGILAFRLYHPEPLFLFSIVSLNIAFLLLLQFLSKRNQKLRKVFGVLVLLCSFLTGNSTAMIHKETFYASHYTNRIKDFERPHLLEIIIQDKLKATKKYSRYLAQVKSTDNIKSSGKIILNLKKSNTDTSIASGTKIRILEPVYKNRYPFNPNQFDYGRYLENQEVYAQVYTDVKRIKTIGQTESITSRFSAFRTKIIDNLKLSYIKQEEMHVLIALLLGQQQDLSPEIVKDYQFAGAVHILSVSGLHVGFILLFVTFILNVFPNTRHHSLLKLFIILLSLWAFGCLAGLSSTVVRSATMFSFVAIGNHIRKSVNVFHTLLVSLLLILLFSPSFLYDIGFQLSYLALFFILWLQPVLSDFWQPKNRIIRYFWDITTVSFAAQIGTLPLSIYYFHQFPGLFFITNLIVLPLVGIIMIAGILCIIFACFSTVPEIIIRPTEILITLLNFLIHQVASLENFVVKNIPLTAEMLWVSYLIIIFFIVWLIKPSFKRLAFTLTGILLLQGISIFEKYRSETSAELIVFHSKKSIITERENNRLTVYSNDSLLAAIENNLSVQPYLIGNFCSVPEKKRLNNLLYFNDKRILIIDASGTYPKNIKPDVVILKDSPKLNLDRLFKLWKPEQIVADGSNFKSYVRLWEASCRKEKIPFHNTNEKGFYKI